MAHVHILGICGTFMAGIALIAREAGHRVTGSDANVYPPMSTLLAEQGIAVSPGEDLAQLDPAPDVVVIGNALSRGHPVVEAVLERGLRYTSGPQWLSEAILQSRWVLAVAGTHGKTTTTSLVAAILDKGGVDPTVINGGIINAYGTNARLGEGEWMVVEADESDGTFVKLPATIAIVTNIDPEHLDYYGTFEAAKDAFLAFVEKVPFYGAAVMCIDHPEVQALIGRVRDRRIVTYGTNPQADIRATNIRVEDGFNVFDVTITDRKTRKTRDMKAVRLAMHGTHNMLNSLAAVGVALQMGIGDAQIREALEGFGGVKRRFTPVGEWNGVKLYDDYGHHPVEIAAVLQAARSATQGRTIAVVQPHRYTRLHNLFDEFCACFNDADAVIVADVYEAGEKPIEGANRDALVQGLRDRGHRDVMPLEGPEALPGLIAKVAKPGDLVVCLGAGSITYWANDLAVNLAKLDAKGRKKAPAKKTTAKTKKPGRKK